LRRTIFGLELEATEITTMARIELEELSDAEQIFIAGSVRLARRAEEWLTTAGIDYAVEVEPFGRSLLFGTERMGAVFYVTSKQAAHCRDQLTAAGLGGGVLKVQE
jgi:hypothetical protein